MSAAARKKVSGSWDRAATPAAAGKKVRRDWGRAATPAAARKKVRRELGPGSAVPPSVGTRVGRRWWRIWGQGQGHVGGGARVGGGWFVGFFG
jgi:hypothetical protein